MSLNKTTLVGKVLSSPDSRVTNSDEQVVRVEVLTGTNTKLTLVCYKSTAEKASALKDGDTILASGSLIVPNFKAQDGSVKKGFELNVRDLFQFSGNIQNLAAIMPGGYSAPAKTSAPKAAAKGSGKSSKEDLSDVLLEDEIPF